MSKQDCNGWTNRATWLVNVWFEPQTKCDVQYAKDTIEETVDSLQPEWLRDFLIVDEINWDELREHCDEDPDDEEDEDDEDNFGAPV